jgi:hypothetical protein
MNTDFRPFAGFKLAVSAYAAIWGTGFLSYLVMPYLIGSVADGMGLGVDRAGLIASAELLIVALMLIPMSFLPESDEARPEDDMSRGEVPMLPAVLIVVGILLWHFCDNSIWGFSERIGNKIGMEPRSCSRCCSS